MGSSFGFRYDSCRSCLEGWSSQAIRRCSHFWLFLPSIRFSAPFVEAGEKQLRPPLPAFAAGPLHLKSEDRLDRLDTLFLWHAFVLRHCSQRCRVRGISFPPIMRTPEEFQEKVRELGLKKWSIHDCGFCNWPCGFLFDGDQVRYDNGCG